MNLRRIFAHAVARRVAYALVAFVLAALGLGQARAQTYSYETCHSNSHGWSNDLPASNNGWALLCPDREAAYSSSAARWASWNPGKPLPSPDVGTTSTGFGYVFYSRHASGALYDIGRYWRLDQECPEGQEWNPATNTCDGPEVCTAKPPLPAASINAPGGGDRVCSDGCAYACSGASVTLTIDGIQRTACAASWNPTGFCSVSDPAPLEPVTDTDGDGTSDENDGSPNNPGSNGTNAGQDESRACGGEGQPECAEDGSNAGSGNGNTSGGGGNCQTPPVSSGDAILAQIAFQTWATRCAIEGNANEGGGSGDGGGPGNGNGDGEQPDWTKGEGPAAPTDDTDYIGEQTRWELPVSTDLLDQENIFGGGSCEHFSIPIWRGVTVSTADFEGWCTLQQILRGLILIFGAFSAIQILLGRW